MKRPAEVVRIALALGGSLLFAEGMLHALSHASVVVRRALAPPWVVDSPVIADERLVFRGNPLHIGHDARGYRNPRALEAAEVVVFGDSHTYGIAIPNPDEVWPRVLERQTGRATYSMALPGIGAAHALLQLDDAIALGPRVIVVAPYFGNDFYDSFALLRVHPDLVEGIDPALRAAADAAEARRPVLDEMATIWPGSSIEIERPGAVRLFLSEHVKLWGMLRAIRWRLDGNHEVAGHLSPDYRAAVAALPPASRGFAFPVEGRGFRTILTPKYRGRVMDDDDPRIRVGYETLRRALVRVSERCRAAGIRLIVVPMPTKEAVYFPRIPDPDSMDGLVEAVADEERLRAEWTDEMDRLGIERVDVIGAFQAHTEPVYFENADGHPNATGHRVVAELLAAKLAATGDRTE